MNTCNSHPDQQSCTSCHQTGDAKPNNRASTKASGIHFGPIDESFAEILGSEIYPLVYPDWQTSQQRELAELADKPNVTMIVAEADFLVVGFVIVELNNETKVGELSMLAVHPDARRVGIGAKLNELALQIMRDAGMTLAELGTGGDRAHAAARRSYERAGYTGAPLVRYYKAL